MSVQLRARWRRCPPASPCPCTAAQAVSIVRRCAPLHTRAPYQCVRMDAGAVHRLACTVRLHERCAARPALLHWPVSINTCFPRSGRGFCGTVSVTSGLYCSWHRTMCCISPAQGSMPLHVCRYGYSNRGIGACTRVQMVWCAAILVLCPVDNHKSPRELETDPEATTDWQKLRHGG